MHNLNDREWKPFALSDLGKVKSGRDIYAEERIEGNTPYITSGSRNNGIGYFVANTNETLDSHFIALNRNGAVGKAFYHPYLALVGNDCRKLHLNECDGNEYVGQFIALAISMQSECFSYSRKLGTARANKLKIMLPVTDDGEPDYQFMEGYMKELMTKKRNQYMTYVDAKITRICGEVGYQALDDVCNIDKCNWQAISIASIFTRLEPGKCKGLNHLKQSNKGFSYIGATNRNNGVLCNIEVDDESNKLLQEGNCIGFIKNGDGSAGYAIYKHEPFISTSDVIYGYADWINRYTGLFFVASQDLIEQKYSHGYKRNQQHLKGDKIMLPITDNGEPDYEFMERYGKKMMVDKYVQYLTFLEANNKLSHK